MAEKDDGLRLPAKVHAPKHVAVIQDTINKRTILGFDKRRKYDKRGWEHHLTCPSTPHPGAEIALSGPPPPPLSSPERPATPIACGVSR